MIRGTFVQEVKEDFTDVCLHGFAEGGIKPNYLAEPLSFSALLVVRTAAVVVVIVIHGVIKYKTRQDINN